MPSTKDLDNPIPEWITERMKAKGHNLAEAAREIDARDAAVKNIITRSKGLGKDLAPRIARYLEIDEAELFRIAGLAPGEVNADEGIYEKQIRTLFRRATSQQKKQIVDVANIILRNGESPQATQSGQRKARGSES